MTRRLSRRTTKSHRWCQSNWLLLTFMGLFVSVIEVAPPAASVVTPDADTHIAERLAATSANPAIEKAMQSVAAAVRKAEADPTRPVCHFRPPALWMNDPNGTIYYKGYYHVFYQHNPYGDQWGNMHWGHTRSKDLIHWEHLPIALWPSKEKGENHCFSGCAALDGEGRLLLFYTSVDGNRRPNEQWAALSDESLLVWQKHPANPILTLETQGGPRFGGSWRDPFIFREAGRTFLVVGADLGDEAVVPIYEAEDPRLTHWTYRGILFRLPKSDTQFPECPNFFKLGEKWVLLCSPYRPVEYFVGSLNLETYTFTPENRGRVDHSGDYYATNVLFDGAGRCVLLAWVRGFREGRGWNGCMALPRIPSIGPDGHLIQRPAPELKALRGKHLEFSGIPLKDGHLVLENLRGDTMEINAVFRPGDARAFGLRVRRSEDGKRAVTVRCDGATLDVEGVRVSLKRADEKAPLTLHLFLDKSVMEVFVNGGRACVTRVIYPGDEDKGVELFAEGGTALLESLESWELKPIW